MIFTSPRLYNISTRCRISFSIETMSKMLAQTLMADLKYLILHSKQYTYRKQVSTETALHNLVKLVKNPILLGHHTSDTCIEDTTRINTTFKTKNYGKSN